MEKRYRIVSPVLANRYLQDESITASQAGQHLQHWLERGVVRELAPGEGDHVPEVTIQALVLPATPDGFAQWLLSVANNPQLLPGYFHADVGMYQFPVGDGWVTAQATQLTAVLTDEDYYRVAIHSGYWNVHTGSIAERKAAERISFRMIILPDSRLKLQARCGVPALQDYFQALLAKILVRWPDAAIVEPGIELSTLLLIALKAPSTSVENSEQMGNVQTGAGVQINADTINLTPLIDPCTVLKAHAGGLVTWLASWKPGRRQRALSS